MTLSTPATKAMKPVLALLVCCLALVTGRVQGWVDCTPTHAGTGPPIPTVPSSIVAGVEVIKGMASGRLYTKNLHLSYDYPGNRAAIVKWVNGSHSREVFNFNTSQMFKMVYDTQECTTVNLTQYDWKETGIPFTVDAAGKTHIQPLRNWLEFDFESDVIYNGTTTIRGIPVNHWYFCIAVPEYNVTVKKDFYFSVPDYVTASGLTEVPVRTQESGRDGYRMLDIFQWNPLRPQQPGETSPFEVTFFCPDRVNTKDVPEVPEQYALEIEVLVNGRQLGLGMEFYDYKKRLCKSMFPAKRDPQSGKLFFEKVLDFNEGLMYEMNPLYHNCSITPIPLSLNWVFEPTALYNQTTVRMKTPQEMFEFDKDFTYWGQGSSRGMETEVWKSLQQDETLTWHFIQTTGKSAASPVLEPVALVSTKEGHNGVSMDSTYCNIFNFKQKSFTYDDFDIKMCFEGPGLSQVLFIKLTGPNIHQFTAEERDFKDSFRRAVSEAADISLTRLTKLSLHDELPGDSVWVGFTMLERANVTGNSVNTRPQKPLQTAIRDLKTAVRWNRFKFEASASGKSIQVRGVPGEVLTEAEFEGKANSQPAQTGLQAGSAAGIAIGTLLVGVLLGAAAVHLRLKVSRQPPPYLTLQT